MKVSSPSPVQTPAQLCRWLTGEWTLARDTQDLAHDHAYRLAGTCTFSAHEGGLLQHEQGMLYPPSGAGFPAEQSYIWLFSAEQVFIKFSDNRPFLTLVPPEFSCDSAHLCGQDTYNAVFDFRNDDYWICEWQVNGPRKNYVMTSRYTRLTKS